MTAPTIECDLEMSSLYYEMLDDYYGEHVLGAAGCTCRALDRCSTSAAPNHFAAAQLSHVANHYAMRRNGYPWQIVVVSMQTGEVESPITMVRRRDQFADRVRETFGQRNAHIKGVTSALRVLWGRVAGSDRAGELLDTPTGPVHVLDAHALVNATLCSSVKVPGSREGAGSDVMHRNCTTHLRAALEILEPTIIHSQGRRKDSQHPTPHRSLLEILDPHWESECVAKARLGGRDLIWVSTGHPSAKGKYAWQHPESPYFRDRIEPELRRAFELASEVAR